MDSQDKLNPRGTPRIPLETQVRLEFERFSGFISEYSSNISEGGMFINTTDPKPVGTVFSFEFRLKDDIKLIQGWGEVVWVRDKAESPSRPAGMGIKFVDLDEDSSELIKKIIVNEREPMSAEGKDEAGGDAIQDIIDDAQNLFEGGQAEDESIEDSIKDVLSDDADGGLTSDVDDLMQASVEEIKLDEGLDDDDYYEEDSGGKRGFPVVPVLLVLVLLSIAGVGFVYQQKIVHGAKTLLFTLGLISYTDTANVAQEGVVIHRPDPARTQPQQRSAPDAEQPSAAANQRAAIEQNQREAVVQQPASEPPQEVSPQTTPSQQTASPKRTAELDRRPASVPKSQSQQLPSASRVLDVSVARSGASNTVVTVMLNGAIDAKTLKLFQIEKPPPRMVLVIPGIQEAFNRKSIRVDDGRLERIRIGKHPDSLHFVFDLDRRFQGESELVASTDRIKILFKR